MKRINFSMWIKAIRVIPRLERDEFNELDFVSKWLIITRSAVFVMTFISASIAGIFAVKYDMFNFKLWLLTTLGLILAHATNNLVNDFVDHLKGVDKENYFRVQYGPHPLEDGLMNFKEILKYVVVTGLIALLIGIYLVSIRRGIAIPLIIIGSFFVLFYTFPLKYIGLGELSVLLVWGPLMVGGAYFIITGILDKNVIIASFPYAIGVTTVLFGKHIDKFDFDKEKGIKTFPVLIGKKISRLFVLLMMVLQYLITIYLVIVKVLSPFVLIVFLSIPVFLKVSKMYLREKPDKKPDDYREDVWPLWYVAGAFWHNRRFGMLYLLGLVIDVILYKFRIF